MEEEVDLLITDVVMPGWTGPELAVRLTEKFPALKSLFMSGYSDRAICAKGNLKPGTAYLAKPFSREQLLEKVHQMLGMTPTPSAPSGSHVTERDIPRSSAPDLIDPKNPLENRKSSKG